MNKITSALKIHPGEGTQIALLVALILVTTAGSSTGGAGIDALFFARFGVKNLPFIYILIGLATFANLMVVSGLLGRLPRTRLYQLLPVILVIALVAFRLLVAMDLRWSYPVLYVGKEVLLALQGFFLWGLAGSLLDARQAKRLFPLFTAGGISGTVIGSFSTPLLVRAFGAENLIIAWALGLGAAFWLCRAVIRILNSQPARHKGFRRVQDRRSKPVHRDPGWLPVCAPLEPDALVLGCLSALFNPVVFSFVAFLPAGHRTLPGCECPGGLLRPVSRGANGPGAGSVTVSGQPAVRPFWLDQHAPGLHADIPGWFCRSGRRAILWEYRRRTFHPAYLEPEPGRDRLERNL